tara:strand:- start:92 stop:265 length:174 start_codon:yes stop_codon:yes gene_type:complete
MSEEYNEQSSNSFIEIKKNLIECLVTLKNNNKNIKLNNYLLHLQTIIDEMKIKNITK